MNESPKTGSLVDSPIEPCDGPDVTRSQHNFKPDEGQGGSTDVTHKDHPLSGSLSPVPSPDPRPAQDVNPTAQAGSGFIRSIALLCGDGKASLQRTHQGFLAGENFVGDALTPIIGSNVRLGTEMPVGVHELGKFCVTSSGDTIPCLTPKSTCAKVWA